MARILPRVRSPRYFHFAGRSWSPASIIDLMERFEAGLGLAALSYFALFVGLGICSPAFATSTHARVESGQRATILSLQSLALQTAGVIGVNVLSRVSELTSPAVAFIAIAVVIGTSKLALRTIGQTVTSYATRHEAHVHP